MENPGVSSALVSPCGARLIVGSDAVRIFDVRKLQAAGGSAARPDEALLTFLPTHLAGSAVENSMRLAGGGLEPIVTYAAFSDCGAWVVANFQSDAAYVFDVRHGSEGMSGGTRCAAASGGMAGASRRREALLRDAVRGMVEKQYCTALARLNELITLPGGDDLRARHLRCECLLRRAWLSDSRAALRDAKFCAAAVAAGPGALEGLLPAALEDQKVASALCGAWKVVFDLQRAKAILGMVVPWGTLFPEWGRCDFEDHRDAFLKIMTTVKRLDYIGDLLDTLLEQVRILEGESKLTLSALGALPSASHGCLVPCAPFFCGVAPRLVLMRDCVEDSKKKLAGLIACALDVSDDNDEDGDTIWLAEICEELHDSLGRPVLAPAFWDSNVRCGYRNRLCGHQNLYTSIKEANFYGAGAQCVMSGSDDGFLYVWDARTGDILSRLRADDDIVNCCIQAPGGFDGGLVATSGLSHSGNLITISILHPPVASLVYGLVFFLTLLRWSSYFFQFLLSLMFVSYTVKLWYATGDGRSLDADASFRSDCEEAFEVNQITTKGHVSSPELRFVF